MAIGSSSLFDVWRMEGEQFGVDLDGLGVDEAAEVAQEGAVPDSRGRLGDRLGRGWDTLLQDLETLIQVILEIGIGFNHAGRLNGSIRCASFPV